MSLETPITPDGSQPACEPVGGDASEVSPPDPTDSPRMDFSTAPDQGSGFASINQAALAVLPALLRRWLPDGGIEGAEYIAINPTRSERKTMQMRIKIVAAATPTWVD